MEDESDVFLTLGMTDHWPAQFKDAKSSSGAKLYVTMERPHARNTWLRDDVLARVFALLQEEIVEVCGLLWVEDLPTGAGEGLLTR